MNLCKEIQCFFSGVDINTAYKLQNIDESYPAWVVRLSDSFGVAVPYEGKEINEEFANVSLYSDILNIENKEIPSLFLMSSIEISRNEFAIFCRDFTDPGENGRERKKILKDPALWWERWKNLIGNSISEKKPYTVLGELVIYEYLLRNKKDAHWMGPSSASHDLVSKDIEIEVKSTLNRYEKIIHITGQFQLQKSSRRLYLYFCRFEENVNGVCINDIVDSLVKNYGESHEILNSKLSRLGYHEGKSSRMEKYQIHEVLKYEVNERFPKIIPEMFKTETLPAGIKRLEYDVDLSVLDGITIDIMGKKSEP